MATEKKKDFDCIEFKRQAQERISKEREGLTPEQQIKQTEDAIAKDPLLGPLWRRLTERKKQQAG